jgi:hypothetical protein
MSRKVYIIGSLRNPAVPELATSLRKLGHYVFDDWYAAGPTADDCWQAYEKAKGISYPEALAGHAARNVFEFDKRHLDAADTAILLMPAGKSGHLELGYMLGSGKTGYVLFDKEPDRWDVMYQFANGVFHDVQALIEKLNALPDTSNLRKIA